MYIIDPDLSKFEEVIEKYKMSNPALGTGFDIACPVRYAWSQADLKNGWP